MSKKKVEQKTVVGSCKYCKRRICKYENQGHSGELCGSCFEVQYRLRTLIMESSEFRQFVLNTLRNIRS